MKKIVICLGMILLLFGCKASRKENVKDKTVTLINEVKDADIWILPKTEENLKTTVWGEATVSGIKAQESRKAVLCEAGDNGLYIIRMIDADSIFYSADDIILKSGWTLRISGNDLKSVTAEVTNEKGIPQNTYKLFAASL